MTRKSPGTNVLLAPLSGMALGAIPSQDEGLSLRDNPSSCGQFYLSFWRSNLISCERVAFRAVSLALSRAFKREIEKKERARGQEGKRARGQEGKRARGQEGKRARGQEGKRARGQEGKRARGQEGKRARGQEGKRRRCEDEKM